MCAAPFTNWDYSLDQETAWLTSPVPTTSKQPSPRIKRHRSMIRTILRILVVSMVAYQLFLHIGSSLQVLMTDSVAHSEDLVLLSDVTQLSFKPSWCSKIWPYYKSNVNGITPSPYAYCWHLDTYKDTVVLLLIQPRIVCSIEIEDICLIYGEARHDSSWPITFWGEVLDGEHMSTNAYAHPYGPNTPDWGPVTLLASMQFRSDSSPSLHNFTISPKGRPREVRNLILEVDKHREGKRKICLRALRVYRLVVEKDHPSRMTVQHS
jgi:hypothetical protein